jgi:ABC-type Zn uptake system ZnuABC Zn-binding protein ZnuA
MRRIALYLAVLLALVPLSCSKQAAPAETARKASEPIQVLCSTFPIYLFTRTVAAGAKNLQVDLMLPAAAGCPHDYALTPQDMQKIAQADVFVANGLGMEEFLGPTFKVANPRVKVIDTSVGVPNILKMTADEDPKQMAPNPHLFASPRMAAYVVANIANALSRLDSSEAGLLDANALAYGAALNKLDDEFAAELRPARAKKIVTEHAIFDYLARDCGLTVAAVVEEDPGQEPAAAEMLQLVKTIKASGAAALFTEPQYPAKVGETIAREIGIPVATLDPVASGPPDAPADYYEKTMRANLETLKRILVAGAQQ